MAATKPVVTIVLVIAAAIVFNEFLRIHRLKHPYAGLNVSQLITEFGYPLEIHEVVTEDGYILTLHRIPRGRNLPEEKGRIPIFFMHGILHSATEFVNLGPGNALSLLLADKGYDIWLGNSRGTTWSRKHQKLNPNKDRAYWDFSFHEIGLYDLPAVIDYILDVTEMPSLHYVGYSQGTSSFFAMATEKPEYGRKVRLMTALAPAVLVGNPKSPMLHFLIFMEKAIDRLTNFLGLYELFSDDGIASFYLKQICDENSSFVHVCLHHFFMMHGFNEAQVNKTMLSMIFSNLPAGVSTKQFLHMIQLMDSGVFQKFNLGVDGNLKQYGQRTPPTYNLSRVSTPVALYYGRNDWTVACENIPNVTKALPNVVKAYLVPLDKFNHNDFVHAIDAVSLLYNSVIEEIVNY